MAALERAVALVEVHEVSVHVAKELHFEVPRARDKLLQKDIRTSERRARFALGLHERVRQLFFGRDHAHAAAAAALRGLEHDGITEFSGERAHSIFGSSASAGGTVRPRPSPIRARRFCRQDVQYADGRPTKRCPPQRMRGRSLGFPTGNRNLGGSRRHDTASQRR